MSEPVEGRAVPERPRRVSFGIAAAVVACTFLAVVVACNLLADAIFPTSGRLATDFSSTYLQRDIDRLAAGKPPIVFLGDSVWWGFGLPDDQGAISLLRKRGCGDCVNLAFKGGNPISYYALLRVFRKDGLRPKLVFLQINLKVFNPVDASDQQLHPGIAPLADPLLTANDRRILATTTVIAQPKLNTFTKLLVATSPFYAMRSDIRENLFGDGSQPPQTNLKPSDFLGTYDLEPLSEENPAVAFLNKAAALLQAEGIPIIAVLTPTNHALVGKWVDTPQYKANLMYVTELLKRHGVHVVNLDDAMPPKDFLDNNHLTVPGQRRLATLLTPYLSFAGSS